MWAGNSSNGPQLPQPPPPPPPPQQQQQQGGRVFVGGKLVQLEELLDAEDELRRTSLIDLLMNDARAEFNVYAAQVMQELGIWGCKSRRGIRCAVWPYVVATHWLHADNIKVILKCLAA
jgi:hypothetical protein